MTDIHIPPAALEAGARAVEARINQPGQCSYHDMARAAFVAMVTAWEGMKMVPYWEHMTHKRHVEMILPLTESPNAQD